MIKEYRKHLVWFCACLLCSLICAGVWAWRNLDDTHREVSSSLVDKEEMYIRVNKTSAIYRGSMIGSIGPIVAQQDKYSGMIGIKRLDNMPLAWDLNDSKKRLLVKSVVDYMLDLSIQEIEQLYENALNRNEANIGPVAMLNRIHTLNLILFNVPESMCDPLVMRNNQVVGTTAKEFEPITLADPVMQARDFHKRYGLRKQAK